MSKNKRVDFGFMRFWANSRPKLKPIELGAGARQLITFPGRAAINHQAPKAGARAPSSLFEAGSSRFILLLGV